MAAEPSRQPPGANTGTLLLRAFQRFQSRLLDELAANGVRIRAKHGAVLANVDRDGTRPTELARRAGIGKPALGELVAELEAAGYVERIADPADGRAKLVVPTDSGLRAIRVASAVIAAIEDDYRATLGDREYERLRRALRSLGADGGDVQPRAWP
jgi:DNA-binding MarR family transcriptional regulator